MKEVNEFHFKFLAFSMKLSNFNSLPAFIGKCLDDSNYDLPNEVYVAGNKQYNMIW
jgi:hypothetical protein